ncbi:phage portal protein [Rhodococcus sp. NPDC058532]|uniref:phage portal protein n=1 Tax=Rhodococcus sp. NPDC058532 TaxID=3346540 RepID=UPI00364759AD
MLNETEVRELVGRMYQLHLSERAALDEIRDWVKGTRGIPNLPEGVADEVKALAAQSPRNLLPLVRDSFVENLSITGYRPTLATDNSPAWKIWQRNRMDARQSQIWMPAVTYGCSYVAARKGDRGVEFVIRSPRQLLAVYVDPASDMWPQYTFETWIEQTDAKPRRVALLTDDEYEYRCDLGEVTANEATGIDPNRSMPLVVTEIDEPTPHGATYDGLPVCPVVRFVDRRDEDGLVVGEIAPLTKLQRAINEVNLDRLIVSRFGAFPQKVITGWSGSADEVLKASARRVWAFEEPDVSASTLAAASLDGYNDVLQEMSEFVAMTAQISPSQVNGRIANVSAEALAAAEANQQRKLAAMRESLGESAEQLLQLSVEMDGDDTTAPDESAEVVWRDTEARTFATTVDGVTKLAAVGVPIQHLLFLVPGMTQQKADAIDQSLRGGAVSDLVSTLRASAQAATAGSPAVAAVAERTTPAVGTPSATAEVEEG